MPDASLEPGKDIIQANHALLGVDVGETLKQDISELQEHVARITMLFQKVIGPLELFDDKYFPSAPARHLGPEWERFSLRFDDYVVKSRASAAAASGVMHSYTEGVLGKVGKIDCDIQVLVAEIKKFKKTVERHISIATSTRSNFKELASDVGSFEHKVERTLKQLDIPISAEMDNTCNNIEALKQKVSRMSDEVADRSSGYLKKMAWLVPGATEALCTLSPKFAIHALRSVFMIPVADVDVEKRQTQAHLEECAATIPALLDSAQIPSDVRPLYEDWWANTREDIRNVTTRIEAITNIWSHLRVDLLTLETNLGVCAVDDKVANSTFLMNRISISRTVLNRLIECLDLYKYQLREDGNAVGA
ncbi:hypothetical protein VTO73DRAFT_10436 [Trametes versicolor]